MTQRTQKSHQTTRNATHPRTAASAQLAIIRETFRERHAYTRTDGGRQTDEERCVTIARSEGGGEERREGRDGTIHQASQTRLDDAQDECPLLVRSRFAYRMCF